MRNNVIAEEKLTVEAMIRLYCKKHHNNSLCEECSILLNYSFRKIEQCRFGIEKPTCNNCTIHCYAPAKRSEIRRVMRYAGPRMLFHHPIMTLKHFCKQKSKRKPK